MIWSPPDQWGVLVTEPIFQGWFESFTTIDVNLEGDPSYGGMIFADPAGAIGQTLLEMELRFTAAHSSGTFSGPYALEFGYVQEPVAANYGPNPGVSPWTRDEVSLGTVTLTGLAAIPTFTAYTLTLSTEQVTQIRSDVTDDPAWSGRLALSVRLTSGLGFVVVSHQTTDPASMWTSQQIPEVVVAEPTHAWRQRVVYSTRAETKRVVRDAAPRVVPREQGIEGR